jgi:hypothetical protein
VKSKLNSKNYYSIDAYSEFKGLTTIHYAEWPILVSYSIIENEKLKFSSGVGNSFKYSLNGNIESPIFISLQ